jgi:hypothetical protein
MPINTVSRTALILLLFSSIAPCGTLVVLCGGYLLPTDVNSDMQCQQFDGGGLVSVDIRLTADIQSTFTLANLIGGEETGSATQTTDFNIGALAGFNFSNPAFSAAYTTPSLTLCAADCAFTGTAGDVSSVDLGTDTSVLAPYIGAGTFNVPYMTQTSFAGLGTLTATLDTSNVAFSGKVTYTFVDTPEPRTLYFIGAGLIYFALRRVRMRTIFSLNSGDRNR